MVLPTAGHVFHEDVPFGYQGSQSLLDNVVLAHDDRSDVIGRCDERRSRRPGCPVIRRRRGEMAVFCTGGLLEGGLVSGQFSTASCRKWQALAAVNAPPDPETPAP